ncbi:MAG: DUF547 domain-containing protein [Pseudomonadota bacterium]
MTHALCALLLLVLGTVSASAQADVDYDAWDTLLKSAVINEQVSYGQWRDNPTFDALVEQVGSADTTDMTRQEQLVFYINAYNILAAQGILAGGSPSSLLGRWAYFKRDKYTVGGQEINLYDLEHELIRPLNEPRIHFAIVCASTSCPILRAEAYTLDRLDQQLDDAARTFINDTRRNRFNAASREAGLSKIFDWFTEDFETPAGSLQVYLADYVADPEAAALLREEGMQIKYLKYDWNLNGTLN